MSDYSLIQQLQKPNIEDKTRLPEGVDYIKLSVIVEGNERIVHIPQREKTEFADFVEDNTKITLKEFNKAMRKFRGIRG